MTYKRIIARLDFKDTKVIKGIQLEGLRVVGIVEELTEKYYLDGIDEILLVDAVASLYEKSVLVEIIRSVTANCFVPITVGGGIRTLEQADSLFRAGADKIAINSAIIRNPDLITQIAQKYGNQAVVAHLEVKSLGEATWGCFVESGRENANISVQDWVAMAEAKGVGEFLVTSIDRDGTKLGPDLDLLTKIRTLTDLPLVASSGFRTTSQAAAALVGLNYQGVAIASALHYGLISIGEIKEGCASMGAQLRKK